MTTASPASAPGSRVLAGWWRQLAPLEPQALWVGRLLLHHVEALVEVAHSHSLDRFERLVLQALSLAPGDTLAGLDARLHLGRPVLGRLLERFHSAGLAKQDPAGGWTATSLTHQALAEGAYAQTASERRVFHFLDRGGRGGVPHFIHLSAPVCTPAAAPPNGWTFDLALLNASLQQAIAWKERHGFPLDVVRLLVPEPPPPAVEPERGTDNKRNANATPAWQRIVVDHPEQLLVALALVRAETTPQGPPPAEGASETPARPPLRLLAFAVRQEGWLLNAAAPVFSLPEAGWREVLPELAEDVPPAAWREAWNLWCQPRGIPLGEAEASVLEHQGPYLRVQAPRRLVEHLRATRSDALKGEAWVVAGAGDLRPAAQVAVADV